MVLEVPGGNGPEKLGLGMIEAKYIFSLCDRFESYLVPLDIHILRQRYNGETFKSTYAVAQDMGISDETVRTIENRALAAIAHCLDLEANDPDITPMRLAKSFRQPTASAICAGYGRVFTAAALTVHRGELIIFASSVGHGEDDRYPYGAIIGRCLLVDWYRAPLPPFLTPISRVSTWSSQRPFRSPFDTLASHPPSTSTTRCPSRCRHGTRVR
jgi:hypothetical protein